MIKLYDTLSKTKKEALQSKEETRLFVCGPTVYDNAHIGHARTYLFFDILVKYLRRKKDIKIKYLQNITDIDDKIIKRAGRKKNIVKKTIRNIF